MKRLTLKRLLQLSVLALAFGGIGVGYQAWDRREMLRTTLAWGCLAPLPASAREIRIRAEGSLFTREYRSSFSAPAPDIERWLFDSPGTREAAPLPVPPSLRRFLIMPGGGAEHAEVTVDDCSGVVRIYVYWS